jgi:hypothetical protein
VDRDFQERKEGHHHPDELRFDPGADPFLRNMVNVYRGTTWAKETALEIIRSANCPPRNKACAALKIAEAVQERIRYINEYPETFQTPPRTWDLMAGDCDDFTTLIASLIESQGITVQVVGMKFDGKWRHVFPRALIPGPGGRSLPMYLDATQRNTPVRQLVNPITKALKRGFKIDTFVL